MATAHRFTTTIARAGARTYLVIPFDPNATWGVKPRHYVTGSINGYPVRGALGADGDQFFLPLGAAWRRDTGVAAGAQVEVVLAPEGPQAATVAPDVRVALDAAPAAKRFFDSLAPFYRTRYLRWIASAKRPETRQARIAELISLLTAGKKQR
jgi:hypothetical protein